MMETSISNASEDRSEAPGMHQDAIIDRFRVEFLDFAADALDELDKLVAAERDLHGDHVVVHDINDAEQGGRDDQVVELHLWCAFHKLEPSHCGYGRNRRSVYTNPHGHW